MSHIALLSSDTINKIAAGEVIERPASVVKELMENALDAGATALTVEVKDGGVSFIRVTDNGSGIPREEVPLAFARHATSKIVTDLDLLRVTSLGFRGEALSSIASVAKVEMITRRKEDLTGTRYVIEGGEASAPLDVGAPEGTTIIVRELFFNTPARRKFLKSSVTEGSYISEVAEKLALSHPDVSFRLLLNGRDCFHTSGNGKIRDIVYTIYGREAANDLFAIPPSSFEGLQISGYAAKPSFARGNRSYEIFFVNGRYVKSGLLTKALENAYTGFLMQHRYPFAILFLEIDPSLVDVNVHPAKRELRFRQEDAIYHGVYQSVRDALSGKELIPSVVPGREERKPRDEKPSVAKDRPPEPFEINRKNAQTVPSQTLEFSRELSTIELLQKSFREGTPAYPAEVSSPLPDHQAVENVTSDMPSPLPDHQTSEKDIGDMPSPPTDSQIVDSHDSEPVQLEFEERLFTRETRKSFALIGQLFGTYWLIQYRDKFMMVDQHAAHEKVLFERQMAAVRRKDNNSQQLNPPVILTLNDREIDVVNRLSAYFTQMGYDIRPFGGKEYAVYGVPYNLYSIAETELLLEMIDGLTDEDVAETGDMIYDRIATMSCKAAIKGNTTITAAEAEALIDELLKLDNPYACPHGRPTMIVMSQNEIEKKFKRIVN